MRRSGQRVAAFWATFGVCVLGAAYRHLEGTAKTPADLVAVAPPVVETPVRDDAVHVAALSR
jgi:hypothetical protein